MASMEKSEPWRCGSWTVLREGLTGVVMKAMTELLEEYADPSPSDSVEEITSTGRKMVPRWRQWDELIAKKVAELDPDR